MPRSSPWLRAVLVGVAVAAAAPVHASTADALVRAAGRLHVALVHFPVALLIVAAVIELISMARRHGSSPTARVCLVIGAVAAGLAAWSGWLNAQVDSTGPDSTTLWLHRWLGISTAVVAAAAAIFGLVLLRPAIAALSKPLRIYRALLVVAALTVGIGGHFGGELVHGSGYITGPLMALIRGPQPAPTPPPPLPDPVPTDAAPDTATGPETPPADAPQIDFASQVLPILQDSCWDCHGDVRRRGKLRLDSLEATLAGGKHGPAVVPGDSAASELYKRITATGDEVRMPQEADPLPEEQIQILKAWIDQGAKWPEEHQRTGGVEEVHWAFVKPSRPAAPKVSNAAWVRNGIDDFVLARLERAGLAPSPEADKATLIRRVTLDLTGLPPTLADVEAFLADDATDTYERLVDRLLASSAYGERWAQMWLDLARYADSRGYEKDQTWTMWPYRDWVINALNADMPFDRFTIEQIAGDLLPDARVDQLVATGFHRCSMINEEGGVDPEEARITAVIDRVNTTAAVWLGATLGCAQCHDHKYDPFTQKDYYSFLAFFNNTPGETKDTGSGEVTIVSTTIDLPRHDAPELERRVGEAEIVLAGLTPDSEETVKQRELLDKLRATLKTPLTTQVMKESEPRETHIFQRGNFLTPGDRVEPDVPAVLPRMPDPDVLRRDRRALAEWFVSPENPLTARVTMNRIWSRHFGRGLVETEEDFGTRGETPTHPELLDWLATEFIARGWSQKAMHRLIVTSATYRQSSRFTPALLERDPHNTLLARGPRFRLDAETIRDQALAIGGLLSLKVGGPSVFPPQPGAIWGHAYSAEQWTPSTGEDAHRRGIYTFIKRATPYPSFTTFDGPQRQVSCTRRSRTNTPLQALVTLNDPVFVEAAAGLARRALVEMPRSASDTERMIRAFRMCTAREPNAHELGTLLVLLESQRKNYRTSPEMARSTLAFAPADAASDQDDAELAAWTVVSNVLLNLDEVLTLE